MKTLALLGGMTYEATSLYYTTINAHVRSTLGGRYSAALLLQSFNFHPLLANMTSGRWDLVTSTFVSAATNLKNAGADALVICANYPHKVADAVEQQSGLKVLHIADFTALAIKSANCQTVGLLGTKAVMEEAYIKSRITGKHGIDVLVPTTQSVRDRVNDELMQTLPSGVVTREIRALLIDAAEDLVRRGAQGLILGSTDLGFALKEGDVSVPLFDTNMIHAKGVAEWMIEESDLVEAKSNSTS